MKLFWTFPKRPWAPAGDPDLLKPIFHTEREVGSSKYIHVETGIRFAFVRAPEVCFSPTMSVSIPESLPLLKRNQNNSASLKTYSGHLTLQLHCYLVMTNLEESLVAPDTQRWISIFVFKRCQCNRLSPLTFYQLCKNKIPVALKYDRNNIRHQPISSFKNYLLFYFPAPQILSWSVSDLSELFNYSAEQKMDGIKDKLAEKIFWSLHIQRNLYAIFFQTLRTLLGDM